MKKKDRRKGVKPSLALSQKTSKLFVKFTTREIGAKVGIDYLTLKKIERRENVMSHKITELESKIDNLLTA